MKPTLGTLFSGGGGWDQGARLVGIDPVFAVELEPWIAKWHSRVFGEHVWQASVADVDYRIVARKVGRVKVLGSSPPCQGTSKSGKGQATRRAAAGIEKGESDVCDPTVGIYTLNAVDALSPEVVLLENNANYEKGATFKAIVAGLGERGYAVDFAVLRAEEYGVPSGRERLIMRATLGKMPPWPKKRPAVTWYDAISDLIPSMPIEGLAPWQKKALSTANVPVGTPLLIAGGNPTRSRSKAGIRVVVHKLPTQKAWATQLASNTSGMRVIDERGVSRRISVRAIARLQGFPDDYPLDGLSRGEAIHVLGNSVPPLLAAELLRPFA